MGGCEINLINEYTAITNPGGLGLLHLEKKASISFPNEYRRGSELSPGVDLNVYSLSAGFPLNILNIDFGLGIAYSNINSKSYKMDQFHRPFSYTEKSDIFTLGALYDNNVRIGLGYTLKQIESSFIFRWPIVIEWYGREQSTLGDFGLYIDYPLRKLEALEIFFSKIDKDNIKHNIIPSFAYVRSNMSDDLRREYPVLGSQPFPEISKYGVSLMFTSEYKEAEIFSFRITHESDNTINGEDIDFGKAGIEIGAGGIFYMRAGFWSASTIDQKVWTYGFGFNLGGLANILYATGKIKTISPAARFILKNIRISADYAVERSDDESIYENSDYFKISFSI
jgi:hypothetical protein